MISLFSFTHQVRIDFVPFWASVARQRFIKHEYACMGL